jgi:hypothetical protein
MTPYEPSIEIARLAPAAVCNVASRVKWLRDLLAKEPTLFTPEQQRRLQPFVARLPFEEELLSSRMDQVDEAIHKLGLLQPCGCNSPFKDGSRSIDRICGEQGCKILSPEHLV